MNKATVAGIALGAAFALVGCAAPASTVSITYDDGAERTVTGSFDEFDCTEVKANGTAIEPVHASLYVNFDSARNDHHASASVYDKVLVQFNADEVKTTREGDRLSVTGEGTVQITERVPASEDPAPGEGFDVDNARETTGTLKAELTCTN